MANNHTLYWLAMRNLPGFGPVKIKQMWQELASSRMMWQEAEASKVIKEQALAEARQELTELQHHPIHLLTLEGNRYPELLKQTPDAPPILYVQGNLDLLALPAIGIVGSRTPTPYGRQVTLALATEISRHGVAIVSGMARGIDAIAHTAALEAGGATIAVWGSGLDKPYPTENIQLAQKILQHGLVVSQYPLGTEAQNFTFPARNKIIAGLSQAVVVTEAKAQSGSLLTAEMARSYDRTVFAVPGSIFSAASQGPHRLIGQGAQLALDAADIVSTLKGVKSTPRQSKVEVELTSQEQQIVDMLQQNPCHIDEIIRNLPLSPAEITSHVTMLEIKGVIQSMGDGEYRVVV